MNFASNLSVQRLGDLMNAPVETYSVLPSRLREDKGQINIEALSFRYAEDRPFLYQNFNLNVISSPRHFFVCPTTNGADPIRLT